MSFCTKIRAAAGHHHCTTSSNSISELYGSLHAVFDKGTADLLPHAVVIKTVFPSEQRLRADCSTSMS